VHLDQFTLIGEKCGREQRAAKEIERAIDGGFPSLRSMVRRNRSPDKDAFLLE
jgi:hypothetical protein